MQDDTELPYRLVAKRQAGKTWRKLTEYRFALSEKEANDKGHVWLEELEKSDAFGVFRIEVQKLQERPVRPKKKRVEPTISFAYHEAGHIVAAWQFNYPVFSASLKPEGGRSGYVEYSSPLLAMDLGKDDAPEVQQAIRNDIIIAYAGRAAQTLFRPTSIRKYHDSLDRLGISKLSPYLAGGESAEQLKVLYKEAQKVVNRHREVTEVLAHSLWHYRILNREEISELIDETTDIFYIFRSKLFDYKSPTRTAST